MRLKFVFIIVLSLPQLGNAQDFRKGYIVKAGGDTLSGLVSYRSARTIPQCEFRQSKDAEVVRFEATELSAFGVDYETFQRVELVSDTLNAGAVFMRVLLRGETDLYRFGRFFFLYRNDELIGLPEPRLENVSRPGVLDGSKYMRKDSRYVAILNVIVGECGYNANETGYNDSDMMELISKHNLCAGDSETLPQKKSLAIRAQVFASYGTSSMTLSYEGRYALADLYVPFTRDMTLSVGGGIDISFPRITDRLLLSTEFWLGQYAYQGYFETPYTGGILQVDHSISLTNLKIPIGLRYDFFGGYASTPYVRGGLEVNIAVSHNYTTYNEIVYPWGDVDVIGVRDQNASVRNPLRAWFGFGYVVRVSGFQLFTELRSEYGGGFVGDSTDSKSTFAEFNLMAGVRF
jgi:hypothetical protein